VDPTFWPLLVVIALVGLLFLLMPGLTRPDVFFAVTVEPAFRATAEGRRATSTYRVVSLASSALALLVLALAVHNHAHEPWAVLALLPQLLGTMAGFLVARQLVRPHAAPPATTREALVAPRRVMLLGGWPLQAVPFIVLAAVSALVALSWGDLPSRMPVHWSLTGQADRWMDRTPAAVFAPLASAGLMCGLMLIVAIGLLHSRRVRVTGEAAPGEASFRRLVTVVLLVAEMLIALAASHPLLLALFPSSAAGRVLRVTTIGGVAVAVVLLVLLVRLGQGGSRRMPLSEAARPVGDRTPDSKWIWGMLYFNADDPALFVEKRFGIGYTLNFGRPSAWALIGLLVGIPVLLGLLARFGL
jgi:uncharacterized membrane protein